MGYFNHANKKISSFAIKLFYAYADIKHWILIHAHIHQYKVKVLLVYIPK